MAGGGHPSPALAAVIRITVPGSAQGDPEAQGHVATALAQAVAVLRAGGARLAASPELGLVVVWGLPLPAGNVALRGVQTAARALDVAQSVEARERAWVAHTVTAKMGLNAGWLARGDHAEGLPGEAAVRVAGRLARAALPGRLLASPPVFRATRRVLDWVATTPAAPQSERLPLPAFMLLSEKPAVSHQALADMGRAPLIGREHELGALCRALQAAQGGGCQLVRLVAEPGAGKSKLLHEWLREVAPRADVRVVHVAAPSYGGRPWQVAEALWRGLGLGDLPEGLGPAALADRLWSAMADRARECALVVVVDDLHWADTESAETIGALTAQLRPVCVVLVLAYRPSFHYPWRSSAQETVIELAPLPGEAVATLAAHTLETTDLLPDVARRLVELAGGNPLQAEELVGLLAETGRLRREGDAWTLEEAGLAGKETLPTTLHEVLLARIALLSRRDAAELDRRAGWAVSSPWERDRLLAEAERLEERVVSWLDRLEAGSYADRREVAEYLPHLERIDFSLTMASILLQRPRPLEQRLTQATDRLFAASHREYLALLRAQASAARVASASTAARAAGRALRLDLPEAAMAFLDVALEHATPDLPGCQPGDLQRQRAEALRRLGRHQAALNALEQALRLTDACRAAQCSEIHLEAATAARAAGDVEALARHVAALEIGVSGAHLPRLRSEQAALALARGNHALAAALAVKALEQVGDDAEAALTAHEVLAHLAAAAGDREHALQHVRAAAAHAAVCLDDETSRRAATLAEVYRP